MFGYIRPVSGELLVREHEFYKAVYCSLCKTGGKKLSQFSRFFLNYDFVFLALTRMSVTDEKPVLEMQRCSFKFKKRKMIKDSPSLEFTAAVFGILSYFKIKDDTGDKKGIKRIIPYLLLPLFSRMMRKARKLYPELYQSISELIQKQTEIEKTKCDSIERAAEPFAMIMSEVASYGLRDEKKLMAGQCGYHIGRFIYLLDALDDCVRDEKNTNYNCLNQYFGSAEQVCLNIESISKTLEDGMTAFSVSYEKIAGGCQSTSRIIYNISTLGTAAAAEAVILLHNERKKQTE